MSFHRLLALFERNLDSRQPLVLCTVIATAGSTYAKPGAQMLIAADGEYAGLLSGGCLEGDLREHARAVADTGESRIVSYDLRSSTDQLFGLGAGCEGAMDILLVRVGEAESWQPVRGLADAYRRGESRRLALVARSRDPGIAAGRCWCVDAIASPGAPGSEAPAELQSLARTARAPVLLQPASPDVDLFVADYAPPPSLVLLGGGPDARPVATLAAFLGWRVVVVDHRSAYLAAHHFPAGARLVESRAADVESAVSLDDFDAAIVMSHHLDSDLQYLHALARSGVRYVGLLGPAARREKLLGDLAADEAARLRPRLRAPVGLDLGGRAPESIALSIIGEVHAVLFGRGGRPFSEVIA